MKKEKVAAQTEVLEYLTEVMRCCDDSVKISESTKAAELIGKHLGMFEDKSKENAGVNVTIVDDIPDKKE